MFDKQLAEKVVRKLSDKSRQARLSRKEIEVPHKFKVTGEVVTQDNFNPSTDLSKLNQKHWQLLDIFQRNGWNLEEACRESGLELDDVKRIHKKIQYFQFEEKRSAALAATLNPAFVAAKHIENVMTNQLEDGQRDSLKELAKIVGAYKTAPTVAIQNNVFQMPQLSVEDQARLKSLADDLASRSEHAA